MRKSGQLIQYHLIIADKFSKRAATGAAGFDLVYHFQGRSIDHRELVIKSVGDIETAACGININSFRIFTYRNSFDYLISREVDDGYGIFMLVGDEQLITCHILNDCIGE